MSDEMYKVVVLVPKQAGSEFIQDMFDRVGDAAYDLQDEFDKTNDRTWDIFCYGTPEKDDK